MQLAAAVLPEIVARPAVLLVVLVRNEGVEHLQYLTAHVGDRVERDDKDEVVPPDMPDKPPVAEHPLHYVVEDAGQDIDHPIAVVVAVAIVVLLEMIQVRVAPGEQLPGLHAPADGPLDLLRAG